MRALAWMRWRLLVNTLRGTRRDQRTETLARVVTVVSWIILVGLLVPAAIGAGVAGWFAGAALVSGTAKAQKWVLIGLQVTLIAQLGVLLLTPLLRGPDSFGNASRLRLLPVPTSLLHGAALLASLGDPWILALLPGLVTLPLGIASEGDLAGALAAGCVTALALAIMMSASTAAELGVQALLRNRRRGEIVMLVVILAISGAGFIPILMTDRIKAARQSEVDAGRPQGPLPPSAVMPTWLELSPPGQVAKGLDAVVTKDAARALLPCATLAGMAALLAWGSPSLHRLVLSEPERVVGARTAVRRRLLAPRALSGPTGALAIAAWRSSLRTLVGRLGVFSPPMLVGLLALMQREVTRETSAEIAWIPTGSSQLFFAGMAIASLNLLGFVANQFAIDRAGLTLLFVSPLSDLDIARGKGLAFGALLAVAGIGCGIVALLLGDASSVAEWLAAMLGLSSAYLWAVPLGVTLSAIFPRAFDPSRVSSSAGPHVAASTLGTLALIAALAAPMLLFKGVSWLATDGWGVVAVAAWAGISALACRALLPSAAAVLGERRERLAMVVAKR